MRWNRIFLPREKHLWFAWHPVRVGNQWVWLEKVYRKTNILLDPLDYVFIPRDHEYYLVDEMIDIEDYRDEE